MKIRITGQSGENRFPFGSSGPWSEFREEVIFQGHEIVNELFDPECDALICHNHSKFAIKEANKNGIPLAKRALVIWEPYIVDKRNYSRKILKQYGKIYTPSPIWASNVGGNSFKWPQDVIAEIENFDDWILRENRFVIIQGNKFSTLNGEMYSLRRKVIQKIMPQVALYGTNWNRGAIWDWRRWISSAIKSVPSKISWRSLYGIGKTQQSFLGETDDKFGTLSKYRLAIVIENSADFVSEKLFDCISAGCLVLYVGPNLNQFDLPDDHLFLSAPNVDEIYSKCMEILSTSAPAQYSIAKAQNVSLRSNSNNWENSKVLRELSQAILENMGGI